MAELGWLGIHLPEEHGGAGAGLSELVVVLDELGRQVAPGPFLPTVLASAVIAQCGNDEQRACYLPGWPTGAWWPRSDSAAPSPCRTACSTATAGSSWVGRRPTCCSCGPATTSSSCRPDVDGCHARRDEEPRPVATLGRRDGVVGGASATPT